MVDVPRAFMVIIYTVDVPRAFMVGAASQAGDANISRLLPGLISRFQGSMNVHRLTLLYYQRKSATVFIVFKASRVIRQISIQVHPVFTTG